MLSLTLDFSKQHPLIQMLCAAAFLALCAQIKIPFYPVSFTLHTFAVTLIGLTLSPSIAASSILCYLVVGNPYSLMGKSVGYFIAFPVAGYMIACMKDKYTPFVSSMAATCLIWLVGFLHLQNFIGWKMALLYGVVIFIPSDLGKVYAALQLTKRVRS